MAIDGGDCGGGEDGGDDGGDGGGDAEEDELDMLPPQPSIRTAKANISSDESFRGDTCIAF
jgi:hypothetical protein